VIGLRLTFTAGRYHATSWDHHVNEGVAEWPPAPWRLLRALVAASYRLDEHEREGVAALLERLTTLPVYRVPPSSTAHLRHYMPTSDSSVKVLDTFVAVGDGGRGPTEMLVWWPELELAPDERALLERLSEQIGYLGRAESWVEVAVADVGDEQAPNVRPQAVDEAPAGATVRLLTAQGAEELAAWREHWESASSAGKAKKRSGPTVPQSVWEALNVSTSDLQRERWSGAPGSCWVDYRLDEPPRVRPRQGVTVGARRGPQGAVFLLDSAVKPSIEQTLWVAERMRSVAMKPSGDGPAPWQLSGKREDDTPQQGHEHAYFLPLARTDGEGREIIDRVLIWARHGLERDAWAHLQTVASKGYRLRGKAKDHPLHLILAGYGDLAHLRALLPCDPERPGDGSWLGPSCTWISATPFVPPRVTKLRGGTMIDSAEDQLRRLLAEVHGLEAQTIDTYNPEGGGAFGWNRFARVRNKDRQRLAGRRGFGFRITFAKQVDGPIALGYGAHFGLGLFRPSPTPQPR
jgi:CRISPR-associated protein Csb2